MICAVYKAADDFRLMSYRHGEGSRGKDAVGEKHEQTAPGSPSSILCMEVD